MSTIINGFEESDLFKLVANYPDAIANRAIELCKDLNEEQKTIILDGFRELGFHLTAAASASYSLTHAVDLMRNHGALGPDIRYLIMQASSELTNAVTLVEPMVLVSDLLTKLGENLDEWVFDVPANLPDDGIDIQFVRNYKAIVPGKLMYFRYTDLDQKVVITDIPCIFDSELFAYLPLTTNPAWKYLNVDIDNANSIESAESTTHTDVEENTVIADGGQA